MLISIAFGVFLAAFAIQNPALPSTPPSTRGAGVTGQFLIRLPRTIEADTCSVQTFQTVAFGGGGSEVAPKKESNTVLIATGRDNKPARTLKAVVWCPGYGVGLIDQPPLDESSPVADIQLTELPSVEIAAKILPPPDGRNLTGLEAGFYAAGWVCDFFNLIDCGVPIWRVARPRVGIDLTDRPPHAQYALEAVGEARAAFGMIGVADR